MTREEALAFFSLPADATEAAIRRAFRAAARKYHPDRAGGSSILMTQTNQAYTVLTARAPTEEELLDLTATKLLLEAFQAELDKAFPLLAIAQRVLSMKEKVNQAIHAGEVELQALEKRGKNFKYKGDGASLLHEVLDAKTKELQENLAAAGKALKVWQRVAERLKEYESVEKAPAPSTKAAGGQFFDDKFFASRSFQWQKF